METALDFGRRGFLAAAVTSLGAAYGVGRATASTDDDPTVPDVLNFALTLERLEAAYYERALASSGGAFTERDVERSEVAGYFDRPTLRYSTYQQFEDIRDHEAYHVAALEDALDSLGAEVTAASEFGFPDGVYDSVESFVGFAGTLEDLGVSAYAGAVPYLVTAELAAQDGGVTDLNVTPLALGIHSVEARHAGLLRTLDLERPWPFGTDGNAADVAVDDPRTMEEVLNVAGRYIGADAGGDGRIARVLSTGRPVPENVGFDGAGNLYVGITAGSVRRLPADLTDETGLGLSATTEVATYPGGVAGVLVGDGVLYTAVNGDAGGVYAVEPGSDEKPTPLATLLPDGNGFVNDLYADGRRLLVTESFGGTVYEVPVDGGDAAGWARDDLLDTGSFGANGVTRIDDTVYVTVTRAGDVGRIVRIPVGADGSAGTPETYVEDEALFGVDGVTARGPYLYAAVNARNRIVRVSPSRRLRTVVEGRPLVFPSEVVFDPTAPERAFVCNFSQDSPGDAGVLRTRL